MAASKTTLAKTCWGIGGAGVLAVSGVLLSLGCAGVNPTDTPKTINVFFDLFDIGSDDCEDLFTRGEFTVSMSVTVQPGNDPQLSTSREFSLGDGVGVTTIQSAELNRTAFFELQPGESFDVEIRITEDDVINSEEPQPWEDSETFDHATVTTRSFSFTNGPGCFSDDRVDVDITVIE